MKRRSTSRETVAAAAGVLMLGLSARAQVELTGVETEAADAVGIMSPQATPGHEKGAKSRSGAESTEPAPEEAPAREWFGHSPPWEWSRLTGDWAGARTALETRGFTLNVSYTLDYSAAWAGGVSSRATYRSLFDANLTVDMETLAGLHGGTLFADYYSTHKSGGSADVGDFQGYSSIETDESLDQLAELWYEQMLLDDVVRIKLGKIDANGEFGYPSRGVDFLNSSAYYSPTIFALTSYPDPSTGVVAFVYPTEKLYVGGGFFDGAATVDGVPTGTRGPSTFFSNSVSDDWFLIAETGLTWTASANRPGRVCGGVWHHTGLFTTWEGAEQSGTTGFYALAEQRLWSREPDDEESERGLHLFGQFGWAEDDVAEATMHAALGASLFGTFESRADDSAGVYLSWVELNTAAGYGEDETAAEVFYTVQLTPGIAIKPDVQYIVNPGGDPALDNAWVGSVRVEVTF